MTDRPRCERDDDAPTVPREPATERDDNSVADTAHARTVRAPLITKLAESQDSPPPRARSSSQLDLAVGQRLGGRYVVRGFLGMGGMGAVYHVFDETLGEDVALKAVRSAVATTGGLRDEVKIAQKVTHENVCRTYDLEDVEGRHFIKMEYVPGETLAARIEAGSLPITAAIRIARGIAAGLAAAHARGIVHRDLKPGNVMLDGARVVLMDFGLAQYASRSDGDRSGTPGYMSPEQLAGVALDPRSDLFALGCLLYEMLTGERVYGTGSMTEIATRQTTIDAPDVRTKRPEIPKWLARATMLLLARDREQRPSGLALLDRGPSPARWPIVLAVAGVVLIGGGIAWRSTRTPPTWERATVIVTQPGVTAEVVGRAAIALDSASFVFASETGDGEPPSIYRMPITGGSLARLSHFENLDQIRFLRDGSGYVTCGGGFRGNQHRVFLQRLDGSRVELGRGHDPDDCGSQIISTRRIDAGDELSRWQLVAFDKQSGTERVLVEGKIADAIDHPRCDPIGRRVVFSMFTGTSFGVYLVGLDPGAKPVRLTDGETPTFTPGGRSIIYANNRHLHERMLDSERTEQITVDTSGPYFVPEVSPDGSTLLFTREEYAATLYIGGPDRPQGKVLATERNLTRRAHLTADQSKVVVEWPQRDDAIVAIDIQTRAQTTLARGTRSFLSRDGSQVYFAAALTDPKAPDELHVVPVTGGASKLIARIKQHVLRDSYAGHDGVHISLGLVEDGQPTGEVRAMRVVDGELVPEGVGLVLPAPRGPWSARALADQVEITSGDVTRILRCFTLPTWIDDHQIGCLTEPQKIEILDVTTDRRTKIELPWPPRNIALAADGTHWLAIRDTDAVTRLAITNFADRPWAP